MDVLRARKRSSERTAMALMMRMMTRIELAMSREQVEMIHTVDKLAQPEEKHGWWLEGSSEGAKKKLLVNDGGEEVKATSPATTTYKPQLQTSMAVSQSTPIYMIYRQPSNC